MAINMLLNTKVQPPDPDLTHVICLVVPGITVLAAMAVHVPKKVNIVKSVSDL